MTLIYGLYLSLHDYTFCIWYQFVGQYLQEVLYLMALFRTNMLDTYNPQCSNAFSNIPKSLH